MKIRASGTIIEWDADAHRMIVLNPGESDTVSATFGKRFIDEKLASKVGGDDAAEAAPAPSVLTDLSLSELIDIAIAEGVIDDGEAFRVLLVGAIAAKRDGAEFDPEGILAAADGIVKTAVPATPDGSGGFAGEVELTSGNPLPQLDHDGDGHPGGSIGKNVLTAEELGIIQKHVGGGHYTISYPGADEPEKIKGREAADARFEELLTAARAAAAEGQDEGDDEGEDAGDDEAGDSEDAPAA